MDLVMSLSKAFLSSLIFLSSLSLAADDSNDVDCPKSEVCPLTVNKINIDIDDVFNENDPKENNWLFRTVNRFKIQTEEATIRRDLLFTEGQKIEQYDLDESERILRSRRYLFNTEIIAKDNGDGSQDIDIKTRDVWTTLPYVKYQTAGGSSDWSFGVHETNLLGKGKRLDIVNQQLPERSGNIVIYEDPNTGWHRTSLYTRFEDNDDGTYQEVDLTRPYFQLSTPNAAGIKFVNFEQENIVYDFGRPMGRYRIFADDLEVFWGTKVDWFNNDRIHRINVGASRFDHEFESILGYDAIDTPENWNADIAWIEYQTVEDQYIKVQKVRHMSEVEDINLGTQFRFRVGYSSSNNVGLNKALYTEMDYNKAHQLTQDQFLFTALAYKGYSSSHGVRGGLASSALGYHWNNVENGQFYVGVNTNNMINGFSEDYMLLGGKSGMRGFPAFFQSGSKTYLVNVEQRYFGQKEWFSLFYLGAAVFYDQGRAWGDNLYAQSYNGTMRDIGVGIRISPTRAYKSESGRGYVLHLDVATPLDGPDGIGKTQLLLKVKHEF
jgi:hypothetical protein